MSVVRKYLSVLLSAVLVVTLYPSNALQAAAAVNLPQIAERVETAPETARTQDRKVKREVIEMRSEHAKVYDHGEGKYSKKIYAQPVHTKKNGKWEESSPELLQDQTTKKITPKNTSLDITFSPKIDEGKFATLKDGEHTLTYSFLRAEGEADPQQASEAVATFDKNRIMYKRIVPGLDLLNTVSDQAVKEDLVLSEYTGHHDFVFKMETDLTPMLHEDGSMQLVDSSGQPVYQLPKPYMVDSNRNTSGEGRRSEDVRYVLEQQGQDWLLHLRADANWLKDSARQYPVYIDPTTYRFVQSADSYVSDRWPDQNYNHFDDYEGYWVLKAGYHPDAGMNETFIRFINPDVRGYVIEKAELFITTAHTYTSAPTPVYLDEVNSISSGWDLNFNTLTWRNRPTDTASLTSLNTVAHQQNVFDITSSVKKWMANPASNLGFKLHTRNSYDVNQWKKFYATEDYQDPPYMEVTFHMEIPGAPTGTAYTNTYKDNGYVDLQWNPVPNATGYKVWIYNGKEYESYDVGNVTSWSTKGKGIWPTAAEIKNGVYKLHHDGKGTELATDPSAVYTNANAGYGEQTKYWFRVSAIGEHEMTPWSAEFMPTIPKVDQHLQGWAYGYSQESKEGFVDLRWDPVPNAAGYKVWIWNGLAYEPFDVKHVTTWSTQNKGIWPTEAEIAAGRYQLHTDGLGTELAADPTPVYRNVPGGIYMAKIPYYQFLVSAYSAAGETIKSGPLVMKIYRRAENYGIEDYWTFVNLPKGKVHAMTGNLVLQETDLTLRGRGPALSVARTFNSRSNAEGPFGVGWTFSLNMSLAEASNGTVTFKDADGTTHLFRKNTDGTYSRPLGVYLSLSKYGNGFQLINRDNIKYLFDGTGKLLSYEDDNANKVTLTYDTSKLSVQDASGRSIILTYDANGKITTLQDPFGRVWTYQYEGGQLISMVDPLGSATEYASTADRLQVTKRDPSRPMDKPSVTTYRFTDGRVAEYQGPLSEQIFTLSYDLEARKTTATDPKGSITEHFYNAEGNPVKMAVDPAEMNLLTSFLYDHNNLTEYRDANSFATQYSYDENGNVTSIQDMRGKQTYTYNENNDITSYTDTGGATWTNAYDRINLIAGRSPAQITDTNIYDQVGNKVASMAGMGIVDNFVPNGGMEDSPANLSGPWIRSAASDNGTITSDNSLGTLSGKTVKVVTAPMSTNWGQVSAIQDLAVEPNTTYQISGSIKMPDAAGSRAYLNSYQMDAAGNQVSSNPWLNSTPLSGTKNVWTDTSFTVKTGSSTAKLRVYLEVDHSGSAASATALFDNVRVIKKDGGTPPSNWARKVATDNGYITVDVGQKSIGTQSVKVVTSSTATTWGMVAATQEVAVKPDTTYTLSGAVKTENLNGGTAFFNTYQFDQNGAEITTSWADNRYNRLTGNSTYWTDRQLTFKTAPNAAKVLIYLEVEHPAAASGAAYFDNIQLIEGDVSAKYSQLVNAGFEKGLNNWMLSVGSGTIDTAQSYSGKQSLKYMRTATTQSAMQYRQTVVLNQTSADPLTLSAASMADNVVNTVDQSANADYSVWINAFHEDGSKSVYQLPFEIGTHGWQVAAKTIQPTKPIQYLDLYPLFRGNNTGTVWFDNIVLQREAGVSTFEYDAAGNYVISAMSPKNTKLSATYDARGNRETQTDALQNTTRYTYDKRDRLKTVTLPGSGLTLQNTYNQYDRLVQKTMTADGKNWGTVSYQYDEAGHLTQTIDAMNQPHNYFYDLNGNMTKVHLPDDRVIEYEYDAANRRTGILYNGELRYKFGYDANGNLKQVQDLLGQTRTMNYDGANRLIAETVSGKTLSYQYDGNDNVKESALSDDGTSYKHSFAYNSIGDNTRVTDPQGKQYRFDFNEFGLANSLVNGNGMQTTAEYDDNKRLVHFVMRRPDGSLLADKSYTYDENGNRTGSIDQLNTAAKQIQYAYDENYQLLSETDAAGGRIEYRYDAVGNRKSKVQKDAQGNQIAAVQYVYNEQNQLTSVTAPAGTVSLVYDAHWQRLLDDGERGYEWDAAGRMTQMTHKATGAVARYQYDEAGRRIRAEVNGAVTQLVYEGSHVAYELDAAGELTRYYTRHENGLLLSMTQVKASREVLAGTYYYQVNEHGDVETLSDATGAVVARYSYDAWGNLLSSDGPLAQANPYRYMGYRFDRESGLYYVNARYYNAQHGRFLSADAHPGLVHNPLTQNGHTYSMNNPVMLYDPTGHFAAVIVVWGVGALIEGLAIGAVIGAGVYVGINQPSYSKPSDEEGDAQTGYANPVNDIPSGSDPLSDHTVYPPDIGSLPFHGKPNSSADLPYPDGTVKQRRYYDRSGRPIKDVDFTDHGSPKSHPEVPHQHTWGWEKGKWKRPKQWEPVK